MITRPLSRRQYALLCLFIDEGEKYYASVEDAKRYDQRPFRSALIQEWIGYHHGRGFFITQKGRDSHADYGKREWAIRAHQDMPLCEYFSFHFLSQRRRSARKKKLLTLSRVA